jgi:hypothetical protein
MNSRRDFLRATLTAGAAASLPKIRAESLPDNTITRENSKPGTRDWLLRDTRIDPKTKYRCPWIEGYCSHTSIQAGETLRIFVSTNPASDFTVDIYRLGYYGGNGGRLVHHVEALPGAVQPDPPIGGKRVRDCQWEPSFELKIPADWVSGVYLGKLTTLQGGLQSYVIFIVRDDRKADVLFQCSDNTWQAYNRWPSQFSLYDNGEHQWWWGGGVSISYNRPYGKYCQIFDAPLSTGSGEYLLWEFPTSFWLEQHGYDVTYISNLDTHSDPAGLQRAKAMLSVGHDEYWSIEMFENVLAAISAGVNVAFLSGNAVCGRVHIGPDITGRLNRTLERVDMFGPRDTDFRFAAIHTLPHISPHANTLIGAHSTGPVTGGADWICTQPDHWLFANTGMKRGDGIPGLVGWEWHGDPALEIPNLEIVAEGPTQSAPGKPNGGRYTATLYPGPKGNIVFNAATIWWGDGLSAPPGYVRPAVYTKPQGPDARVQQITRNLLAKMLA